MSDPPATPPAEPIPGFAILGVAGRGGMATVYRAEQASPRRIVALKVLSRSASPSRLASFQREAATIAALEHPRIVPLYGYGEHQSAPYLVLRFLGGGTVADRLESGPLDLREARGIVRAVSDALDFAHQRGLVHRDIKPSNILLDEQGRAYLTDFGIAGALADPTAGPATGSAAYMSPEQAAGAAVDLRSDVYSLAVTLFEMLTGSLPYSSETAMGMIVRHARDPIPSARRRNPQVPPAVDELLGWGMAKSPRERPASAREFDRLLEQAVSHPSSPLRPAGAALPAPAARSALRWWWLAAAVVGGVCVVGAALLGGGALGAILSRPPTPLPTPSLPPPATRLEPTSASSAGLPLADDFSDSGSGFAVPADADGGVSYVDGALQITSLAEGIEWFSPSGRVQSADVQMEVAVRVLSPHPAGEIGLACRWNGLADYTAAAIRSNGTASIWERRGGDRQVLFEGPVALPFDPNGAAPFRLTLICSGETIRLLGNGVALAIGSASAPRAGDITLWAGILSSGQFSVAFDDLSAVP